MGKINYTHMPYTLATEVLLVGATAMIDAEWLVDNGKWVALAGVLAFPVVALVASLFKTKDVPPAQDTMLNPVPHGPNSPNFLGGGGQASYGAASPNLRAEAGSTVNLHFHIGADSYMPEKDEENIRRLLERNGGAGHTVTSHHQSGGITAGEINVYAEDKSLKRQLRNLLAAADSRIPFEIDGGNLEIETRMTAAQFVRLEQIAQTNGSAALIRKADVTGRFVSSMINNGTFGPATAEAEQIRVKFQFNREIME